MTRKSIGLFLIIWMLVAGRVDAADLQEILNKHLDALGGREAVAAVKSVAAYSSVKYMGLDGRTVSLMKFPDRYYTTLDLGVMAEVKGCDGLTAWTTDVNGVTRRDIPEELKPTINELYLATYSYVLSGRNPGRVEYRGDTVIEGHEYHNLAMFPEGGDSLFVFINRLSGRLEYRAEMITGINMITAYSDFRKIGGIEAPFAMEVETPDAPYEISARIDSVRINLDLSDSIFLMPGETAVDYHFPEGADSAIVPFENRRNGIMVKVRVNGRGPFWFLLDSGAATTLLSKTVADDLGLQAEGAIPARGVGGFGSMGFAKTDSLSVGPLSWDLGRIAIFDFGAMSGTSLARLDGILGYDFFARFPVLIDFDRSHMILFDPASDYLSTPDNPVDIDIYCQVPVLEVNLDGYPLRLALDLGAQMGLVIQGRSRWYKEMSANYMDSTWETTIQGVGGVQTVKTARGDSLNIGGLRVNRPTIMMSEDYAAIPFPDYIEGFLGMEILKRFNLLIDYAAGKVYFRNRDRSDK